MERIARRDPSLLSMALLATIGFLMTRTAGADRPEVTLLRLLAEPFAPTRSSGPSPECLRDSGVYIEALGNYSVWALQMYDSSAKIPAGILTGNIRQLGNYDQCLEIETGQKFNTQACSASVQFKIMHGQRTTEETDMNDLLVQAAISSGLSEVPEVSVNYEWLWCVPSSCSYLEIDRALKVALSPLKVKNRLDITVRIDETSCHTAETDKPTFDSYDWAYISLIGFFGTVIILSTSYDLVRRRKQNMECDNAFDQSVLTSFSLYTNGKALFNTKGNQKSIGCIDGIRYLSICWIIYGHTFYQEAMGVKMNRKSITKLHEDWSSMLALNGNVVTDTFFLLSGILLSYTFLCKKSKNSSTSINVPSLYLIRYIRLTPAYVIVIGFYATLFDKLGSGPMWNQWVSTNKLNCRVNWWTNVLYINNYVNVENICMSQSWYLSMDMQLLWMSPVFLYPLVKFNRSIYFWTIVFLGLIASILVPFFVTYHLHLTGTMLYYKNLQDVTKVYLQIYTRVYARAGPYIIGIALGFILFKDRSYKYRIASQYVVAGWTLAIVAAFSVIFVPRGMYFDDHMYNKYEASFYAGLHRHMFAMAVAWIILACTHGYAGPINTFLSWRGWIPLSRLTYCAYLTHFTILLYRSGSERTSDNLTKFGIFHSFLGNLGLTMLISLALSLSFEMPFMSLVHLALGRPDRKNLIAKPSTESILDRSQIAASSSAIGNVSTEGSSYSIYTIGKDYDNRPAQSASNEDLQFIKVSLNDVNTDNEANDRVERNQI